MTRVISISYFRLFLYFQSRSIREFDHHATCIVAKYEVPFMARVPTIADTILNQMRIHVLLLLA